MVPSSPTTPLNYPYAKYTQEKWNQVCDLAPMKLVIPHKLSAAIEKQVISQSQCDLLNRILSRLHLHKFYIFTLEKTIMIHFLKIHA
jgi:hypothetical protein